MWLLVVVLLVLAIGCAGWVVGAAHRRAAGLGRPVLMVEEAAEAAPVRPYVDAVEADLPTGGACDAYADPVDGVPFAEGEEVVSCRCGVGYRGESVEWLAANFGGRCVECGCVFELHPAGEV